MRSTLALVFFLGGCFVNDVDTEISAAGGTGTGAAGAAGPGGMSTGGVGPGGSGGGGAGGANPGGSGGGGAGAGPGPGGSGTGGSGGSTNPTCGDGIIQATDQCEDGNDDAGDQCDVNCQFEEANCTGSLDAGEECDSGAAPTPDCANCTFTTESSCAGLPTHLTAGVYAASPNNSEPFVSVGLCAGLINNAPTHAFNVNVGPWPRGLVVLPLSPTPQTRLFASAGCTEDLACSEAGYPSLVTDVFEPGSLRSVGIAHPPAQFRLEFSRHFARFSEGNEGWTIGSGFSLVGGGMAGNGVPSISVSPAVYVGGLQRIDIRILHTTSNDGAVDVKIRPQGATNWLGVIDSLGVQTNMVQGFATDIPSGTTWIEIGIDMKSAVSTVIYGVLVVEDELLPP